MTYFAFFFFFGSSKAESGRRYLEGGGKHMGV